MDSLDHFLTEVTKQIQAYISHANPNDSKVIDFHQPASLKQKYWVQLQETWLSHANLLEEITSILEASTSTIHPYFFNQLYAWADVYGIVWEYLAALLNTSMATYEIAPLFTLMEQEVFAMIADKISRDVWSYTGLMVPWGSLSNQYSIMLARTRKSQEMNKTWLFWHTPLALFTSEQWHYSISKSAIVLWIGKENVYKVPTDQYGKMDINALTQAIQRAKDDGKQPFYVNATASTTVLGAFDPIADIATVAKEEWLRVHVDACRWWASMFTETHHHKLTWASYVDSLSFNAHKMLRVPQQCSLLMIHDTHSVQTTCSLKANYLFQEDRGYDISYDTGDNYIQCARKADVLKLWLVLKAHWLSWIQKNIEKALTNAQLLAQKVKDNERFFLLQEPEYANVCFRRIPPSMRAEATDVNFFKQHYDFFNTLTACIKTEMLKQWKMMINYQPLGDLPNFIRFISITPDIGTTNLDEILQHIDELWTHVLNHYEPSPSLLTKRQRVKASN